MRKGELTTLNRKKVNADMTSCAEGVLEALMILITGATIIDGSGSTPYKGGPSPGRREYKSPGISGFFLRFER